MNYYLLAYKATNLAQDDFIEGGCIFKNPENLTLNDILSSSQNCPFFALRNLTGRADDSALKHIKMFKEVVPKHHSYAATYSDQNDQYDVALSFGKIENPMPILIVTASRNARTLEDTINRVGIFTLKNVDLLDLGYGLVVQGLADTIVNINQHIRSAIDSPGIGITLSTENDLGSSDYSTAVYLD